MEGERERKEGRQTDNRQTSRLTDTKRGGSVTNIYFHHIKMCMPVLFYEGEGMEGEA